MLNIMSTLHGSTGKRKASAEQATTEQATKQKKSAPKGSSQIAESSRASTATTSWHTSIATEEEEESHYGYNAEIIKVDHSGNERRNSSSPEISSEDELSMVMSIGDELY